MDDGLDGLAALHARRKRRKPLTAPAPVLPPPLPILHRLAPDASPPAMTTPVPGAVSRHPTAASPPAASPPAARPSLAARLALLTAARQAEARAASAKRFAERRRALLAPPSPELKPKPSPKPKTSPKPKSKSKRKRSQSVSPPPPSPPPSPPPPPSPLATDAASPLSADDIRPALPLPEGKEATFPIYLDATTAINRHYAVHLRDYQVAGVKFLYSRVAAGKGALLGDSMGLGKTTQLLALLSALNGQSGTMVDRTSEVRCMALVVVPGSVMYQWRDEVRRWTFLRVCVYHGSQSARAAALHQGLLGPHVRPHILVTTYGTARRRVDELSQLKLGVMVFDEIHCLRNPDTVTHSQLNKLQPRVPRIGLSGTIVQNKLEELYTVVDFVARGHLGSYNVFVTKTATVIRTGRKADATNGQIAAARFAAADLVKRLRVVLLQRDKSVVARTMPRKSEYVVICPLTRAQMTAYRVTLESPAVASLLAGSHSSVASTARKEDLPHEKPALFRVMVRLGKIANHLGLLLPRASDEAEKQARDAAFLESVSPPHALLAAMQRGGAQLLALSSQELCGKMAVVRSLLTQWAAASPPPKILLFSYSTRILDILESSLVAMGTDYCRIDGSVSLRKRHALVTEFNNSPLKRVFLLSGKAGALGLNLTAATKVIIFDPHWNPAFDKQAQDRAYRIGQSHDVEVFRLIASGTIEELVYNRQVYKEHEATATASGALPPRFYTAVLNINNGELFGMINLLSSSLKHFTRSIKAAEAQRASSYEIADASFLNDLASDGGSEAPAASGHSDPDAQLAAALGVLDVIQHKTMVGHSSVEAVVSGRATSHAAASLAHVGPEVVARRIAWLRAAFDDLARAVGLSVLEYAVNVVRMPPRARELEARKARLALLAARRAEAGAASAKIKSQPRPSPPPPPSPEPQSQPQPMDIPSSIPMPSVVLPVRGESPDIEL
ncbi:CSB DNA-binding protein [Thecamonas trahens ATCC 50062]|uniref:CSB DNA-binding protein n=1 Tax=Thecamonas trahens ATCC 50062 TaxID=461836 RepID=A0A0L0DFX1_THETB|nr:CSB DNA-binding protein [Thecamonas trahens ATCC 50062]KNC51242.1 CSB DNA-binding protein [Thecamonas trahens ATCC 50062]|eukprot:XP_013756174.1 CSB DNA-binding protein [Thecamonas trahens ATCC 50062]